METLQLLLLLLLPLSLLLLLLLLELHESLQEFELLLIFWRSAQRSPPAYPPNGPAIEPISIPPKKQGKKPDHQRKNSKPKNPRPPTFVAVGHLETDIGGRGGRRGKFTMTQKRQHEKRVPIAACPSSRGGTSVEYSFSMGYS